MGRKDEYIESRINRYFRNLKVTLLLVFFINLLLVSFSNWSDYTYSYFTAGYKANSQITNATKEDLVKITEGKVVYKKDCVAKQDVTILNVFDYFVDIKVDGTSYRLSPGEETTHTKTLANSCGDFGTKQYHIIGFVNYFDHVVNVEVEKEQLNPCPQPAIDKANGKPNDNGQGKHCGNQGKEGRDEVTKQTTETDEEESTKLENDESEEGSKKEEEPKDTESNHENTKQEDQNVNNQETSGDTTENKEVDSNQSEEKDEQEGDSTESKDESIDTVGEESEDNVTAATSKKDNPVKDSQEESEVEDGVKPKSNKPEDEENLKQSEDE
ncbi:hypothetical protein ACGTN9_08695 [Halobacillus sp. MO56]